MKSVTRYLTAAGSALALALALTLPAQAGSCGGAAPAGSGASKAQEKSDIVTIAAGNETFSTLVAAVQAAGLVEILQSEGPFTVLAPTNEAFAALPEGTLESLLLPENRETLIAILTYHVIPAKAMAADVVKLDSAPTIQGSPVAIHVKESKVVINHANVIMTDVKASNGVIHVIDAVLLPPMASSASDQQ